MGENAAWMGSVLTAADKINLNQMVSDLRDSFSGCRGGLSLERRRIKLKNVTIAPGFFNIFIVILRDFVLSRRICNLRWARALRIKLDLAAEGQITT